ncbi:182 kDa tankyrase-1-binding protein isoform 2-T3 [Porphyrio hochstetteri]
MASQPQPLCPALPCASSARGAGLAASSPEKGTARPKPPVRPKPRVLPKPALPAKPSLPHTPPGLRHPRPELPSAEKMNRLAGPQPYVAGSSGGPLRRPSFTLKSAETPNGKGLPSPPIAATENPSSTPIEEVPPTPPTPSRKGPAPFKVTPVPVATKPERFPGTTVEEILAKMDSREGPRSPDRSQLSSFCPDPPSRFSSKTFSAFRRCPSGDADGTPPSEARQTPQPTAGELGTGDDRHPVAKMSGSPPAGPSYAGDPHGCRRPPSPPDLSSLQPGALEPPGSPRPPACLASGAPFQPTEPSASAPGSPDAPPELPAPGSPTLAPGSPESPARPVAKVSAASIQAPGAPSSAAEARLGVSRSPGSPNTPGEGSPDTVSPPGTPELPPRATCPPGSPEAAAEYPSSPSPPPEPPAKASCPPGSPEGPDDSLVSPWSSESPNYSLPPPSRDSGLRRASEGVLRPMATGQGMGEVGGSLSALPRPGDVLLEQSLGSESGWSLSQSFEWTFPSRGARWLASPPKSPIREVADSGLSGEGESDGEGPSPCPPHSRGDSGSEGPGPTVDGSRGVEGAPCPGGPVAQQEAEGSEEETEAEQSPTVPRSPLCVMEPETPAQPALLTDATPSDLADSAWALVGDHPVSLQGPGGPGQAEGSSRDPNPHADPGWLTELLASPGAHAVGHGSPDAEGTQDLLGWSRKDLCSEFGIGRAQQAGSFSWTQKAVTRERDWPGETEGDREFGTKSSWDSTRSIGDGDRHDGPFSATTKDWGSDYKGTEPMGEMRLSCSDWSKSHGVGESCLQDRDFGAGKPSWGVGYGLDSVGSREEPGPGKADWSSDCGAGHGQQRDEQPNSRRTSWVSGYSSRDLESRDQEVAPAWTGGYSTGEAEMKDRELTLDWASKYSNRDAETKDKDFTLGWAGRSSTGDAGTPEKFSRPAWDSKYSTQDMESQDREFSPSRPAWDGERSTQDMESQDQEFSPSRLAWDGGYSARDVDSQDQEFSSSKPAWDDGYSSRDVESWDQEFSSSNRPAEVPEYITRDSQDREFSPSRPAWTGKCSTRDIESQDREFSPSRPAWASECSSSAMESQDGRFSPSRPAWQDECHARDVESQDREFSPSRPAWASKCSSANTEKEGGEFSPVRLSWAGECSVGQTELVDAFGVRKDDLPGSRGPDSLAREPAWGSSDQQERGTTESRDWAEELGGTECHNQFGIIGTERVPDSFSTGASSDGSMSWASRSSPGDPQKPLSGWRGDFSFSSLAAASHPGAGDAGRVGLHQTAWGQGLGTLPAPAPGLEEPGWSRDPSTAGWSAEQCNAEAKRQEWASAFGARCAARSRDFGTGEQSPGGDTGSVDRSVCPSDPSPLVGDAPADPLTAEPPRSELSGPMEEERDISGLAAAPRSPRASPLLTEASCETPSDLESEEPPSDHPDGKRPPSWEEKQLSLGTPQAEGSTEHAGQEFSFLEDTEILDSSVYRSKANLGRKRRHRVPALRPGATSEGDSWIFRDSTEPRPARPAASSDEEAVEEPKSRRVRASTSGKGVKVPLFPGLNTSALKAKLRGRNRSAEEGAVPGDSKAAPPKDAHVQRSKSCKIPGLSGKPLTLPPKPEKSSGSEGSPPHWLQALKLKKKKP